jgi:hypothetical protein
MTIIVDIFDISRIFKKTRCFLEKCGLLGTPCMSSISHIGGSTFIVLDVAALGVRLIYCGPGLALPYATVNSAAKMRSGKAITPAILLTSPKEHKTMIDAR